MKRKIILMCSVLLISLVSCQKDKEQPKASFSVEDDEVFVGQTVKFTNESTNASSYSWDFGDGSTSALENPTHVFNEAGTFTVTLSVENGEDEYSMDINVTVSLTGTWDMMFIFDDYPEDIFPGYLEIEQQNDNSLEGSFVFIDGSGYSTLNNGSEIDGDNVSILWTLDDTYDLDFEGNVNNDFDEMSGIWYTLGTRLGTWSAEKEIDQTKKTIQQNELSPELGQKFKNNIEAISRAK
jgi:PKD repeat protein